MICEYCDYSPCVCNGSSEFTINDIEDFDDRHENLVIVYLGDFLSDARCINMANSFLQVGKQLHGNTNNYNVSIVSTDDIEKVNTAKKKSELIQKIHFFPVKVPNRGLNKYIGFHKQVNSVLKNKTFDCIVSGDLYSLASAVRYKKKGDSCDKIIYDCREIYSDLYAHRKKPILRWICKIYESFFIKETDRIIVTAKSDKEILSKKYSFIDKKKWHVIYNYPKLISLWEWKKKNFKNFEEYQSFAKQQLGKKYDKKTNKGESTKTAWDLKLGLFFWEKIRKNGVSFNLPKNTMKIIYQGVIQKGRGIEKLIRLTQYSQKISSVILGSGPEKNTYVNLAKQLNVDNKIIFIDSVDYLDVCKYSLGCDIGWCLINTKGTSNQNALPNKLFEYVMMGLPVISSDLPNVKKIINQHKVGRIITDDNLKNLEKEIIELMKTKKNREYYNDIITEHFTFESQLLNFMDIIDDGDYHPYRNIEKLKFTKEKMEDIPF